MKKRLSKICLFLLFSIYFPNLFSDDFIVDTNTTLQNGGYVINGDDSLTITENGAISVVGTEAVLATGSNNTINNEGALQARNSGVGIYVTGSNNTVNHSGTLYAFDSLGVDLNSDNKMVNTGRIEVRGISAIGVQGNSNTLIVNEGVMLFSISSGTGVDFQNNNVFINSGSVLGYETNLFDMVTSNTLINTGEIITTGSTNIAIIAGVDNQIINSGKVVSADYQSFLMNSSNNRLALLAPSFIGGVIDLGAFSTIVTVKTGPSHSVLWDFSTGLIQGGALDVSGSVPYFYNIETQKFATFDPSALSTAPDFLADVSGSVCRVVQQRMLDVNECCNPCFCITPWVSFYGSHVDYGKNHAILKRDVDYWNVLIGAETNLPYQVTAGLFAGYGKGFIEANSHFYHSFNNNADGFIGGGYLKKIWDCCFVDVVLSGGNLSYSDERYVNDNLARLGEAVPAKADYDSFWISPEVMIGKSINSCYGTSFIPNICYRYAYQSIDKYDESNTTENATVYSRDIGVGELKAELLAKKQVSFFDLAVKGGYLLRNPVGDSDAKVTLLGLTQTIPSFADDHSCGYIGAQVAVCHPCGFEFKIDGEFISGHKMKGGFGQANLSIQF